MAETVVALRPIEQLIDLVTEKWKAMDTLVQKYRTNRLEVGDMLNELRQRVENGEQGDEAALSWWQWYEAHFTRSRNDAEKIMALAAADDPQKASDLGKERNRVQKQQSRARLTVVKNENTSLPLTSSVSGLAPRSKPLIVQEAPPEPDLDGDAKIDQIVAIFETLDWKQKARCITRLKPLYNR